MLWLHFVATEAEAIANFSHLFRRPEGVWLSPSDEEHMEQSLINGMDGQEFDLVVVSDGEAILGTSLTYGDLDSFSIEDPNRRYLLLNHISCVRTVRIEQASVTRVREPSESAGPYKSACSGEAKRI
jgi:hypothetical protein